MKSGSIEMRESALTKRNSELKYLRKRVSNLEILGKKFIFLVESSKGTWIVGYPELANEFRKIIDGTTD